MIAQDLLLQRIYNSLVENHYRGQTGLYLSFYDTGDRKLSQQSSTYDQGALGLLLLELGEWERAERIVSFFAQEWEDGPSRDYRQGIYGLANFYNAIFGGDGIEKTIHVGPNVWIGTLVARYVRKTGDARYWTFARDMAVWIGKSIQHRDGGVAMGPVEGADGVPWPGVFSTENNLSYYAFLCELEKNQFAGVKDKKFFSSEKRGIENWLVNVAYDRQNKCMNRGYNPLGVDKVRALDTHTWLVSAVGPERMVEIGLDPDVMMDYAKVHYVVTVKGMKGVDFTDAVEARRVIAAGPDRPAGDGNRLVWLEGLGQYIAALGTMADYHARAGRSAKAKEYSQQAEYFTNEFEKASFNLGMDKTGYPYSWPQFGKTFVDGWYVPKPGAGGYASAVIASVWKGFAEIGYDPLADKYVGKKTFSRHSFGKLRTASEAKPKNLLSLKYEKDEILRFAQNDREVAQNDKRVEQVLYGASCDMASRAWALLDEGNYAASIRQAQALVEEWSGFADQLQFKKEREIGEPIYYDGSVSSRMKIFSYWALNDVGAALYVMARAGNETGDTVTAKAALEKLLTRYRLAQVWDTRGWFWSPLEAIREEFINYVPDTYGYLASIYEMQPETRMVQLPSPIK